GFDSADAPTCRHVLIAGEHYKKRRHYAGDRRAEREQLVEQTDDRSRVHEGKASFAQWESSQRQTSGTDEPPRLNQQRGGNRNGADGLCSSDCDQQSLPGLLPSQRPQSVPLPFPTRSGTCSPTIRADL